jgi:hypothetical protein
MTRTKAQIAAYRARWYEKNRDKVLDQSRAYKKAAGPVQVLLPGTTRFYRCTHDEYEKYLLIIPSGTRVRIDGKEFTIGGRA